MAHNPHRGPGLIPLDSSHKVQVHDEALEKAAALLEATAVDYDETAARAREMRRSLPPVPSLGQGMGDASRYVREANEAEGRAALLRGQAAHIRELKVRP